MKGDQCDWGCAVVPTGQGGMEQTRCHAIATRKYGDHWFCEEHGARKPMKGDMVCEGHLGGYVSGGDEATHYPALWDWLVKDLGIRSVIDVGCGDGVAVRHFEKLLEAEYLKTHTSLAGRLPDTSLLGVDGCRQAHPNIIQHDYALGPFVRMYSPRFDLAWSCEFVEHVEERYMPNFLATFACAKTVLMTHAAPGQGGHHHVNCRPADYWIGALAAIGFSHDAALTRVTRELAGRNSSPWNHYKRSGLAFTRN